MRTGTIHTTIIHSVQRTIASGSCMPSDYNPSSPDLWYFAYGSNLDVERKEDRTGSIREAHIARLSGYRLAFNKRGANGEIYANLLPNPTEEVYGVIYRCTPEALVELDYHEGVSSEHDRQETIQVKTLAGQTLHAIAYVANPQYIIPGSPPSDEYLGHILRGARSHGLTSSVIRAIETQPSIAHTTYKSSHAGG